MSQNSTIRKFIDRNVERLLVREFLLSKTEKAGFGGLDFQRTPEGTKVTLSAERVGMVIGRKGKICLLYTSPSPRDVEESRMPSSA